METRWTALFITSACLCSCGAASSTATAKYYSSATPWKQWTIGRRPCEGVQGETGHCMFNWECIRQEGTMLSACMDGFLLGACCKLPHAASATTTAWTEPSAHATQDLSKVSTIVTVDATSLSSASDTHPEASRLPPSTTTTTKAPTTVGSKPTTVLSRPRPPSPLWPVLRLPTTLKRPVVSRPTVQPATAATVTNHHKPPGFTAPAVTTWMTTRPNVLFAPTKLAMRPSPFVPSTMYVQRPTLQAVLASTPIGMLSTLIARPFIRPITTVMKMRPTVATMKPAKKTTALAVQPDTAATTAHESTSSQAEIATQHSPTKKYETQTEASSQTMTAQKYEYTSPPSSQTSATQNYASATTSFSQTTPTQGYEPPSALSSHSTLAQKYEPPTTVWSQTAPTRYEPSSTHYLSSRPPLHTLSSPAEGYTSHAVSRLPPSTLNDLSDLDAEEKTTEYQTALGILLSTQSENIHPTRHPDFVDLTETSTAQPPPTPSVMEYTLEFDVEDRPTITEHEYGVTTGRPSFGEVSDVTVSHVGSTVVSSSTEPFSTPPPSTTTKKLKTRSPTTQTKPWPHTVVSKPSLSKPRPPQPPTTISNHIHHLTYPSKATLWPSTVFKLPLRTKLTKPAPSTTLSWDSSTASLSTYQTQSTSTTVQTTSKLPERTKKPTTTAIRPLLVKTTLPMTTATTKPKSTPKPMKPVLAVPAHPAKPTKTPLPIKSPTKKSTPKPPSKIPPAPVTFTHASTVNTKPTTTPVGANSTVEPVETSSKQWDYRKHCGVRPLRPQGRIVGGRNSFFGEWPWQVLVKEATWLGLFIKNKCGGVLISAKYALTAAHCQPGFLSSLLVILGEHDISGDYEEFRPVSIPVRRMVVHRHYNPATFENDLALLELERSVIFQPHIVPICLPGTDEDFTGRTSYVTGWGKLSHGGSVPNVLQYVQVPILSNAECQRMFMLSGHSKSIKANFVCAGYDRGNRDSCEGDSGGPLTLLRDDGRWVLVGTVSHGIRCAEPNMPGVYMRTSAYRPWIDSVTAQRATKSRLPILHSPVSRKPAVNAT